MIKLCIPEIGLEEINAVREVLESGMLVQGEKVFEFEKKIEKYLNVKNAIAVSSGTAALHLSLMALGVKSEDEVIVPDFTFPATANVVESVGANCKFVDINLESFCIDANKIEEKITNKTKVIMPVQEFGQSSDMDKIVELAKKYNLKIIEDAACALGTEYKGKKVGTIGDLGCFSLHPRKAITTGEGGIIVTNDDKLAEKVRILRNHGISYENGKAEFVSAGLNYRMTDIQGAMALIQIGKLEKINEKRKELAEYYNEVLKNIKSIKMPKEECYGKHVWQTYHILVQSDIDRNKLINDLRENGIEANFGAYAVHNQHYYKNKYQIEGLENSVYAYEKGIALPLYAKLDKSEIKYIGDTLEKLL